MREDTKTYSRDEIGERLSQIMPGAYAEAKTGLPELSELAHVVVPLSPEAGSMIVLAIKEPDSTKYGFVSVTPSGIMLQRHPDGTATGNLGSVFNLETSERALASCIISTANRGDKL